MSQRGLIKFGVLSGIGDRVAAQVAEFITGFNAAREGNQFYPRIHSSVDSVIGDYDVEADLISAANGIDTSTYSGVFLKNVYSTLMSALSTHATDAGAPSFNSFLNTSGPNINFHSNFEEAYFRSTGTHMLARNVFFPDANILTATYAPTASGTGIFASGTDIGTGTGNASTTNHAAAKFVLVPVGDVTADTQFNIRLTRENPSDGNQADAVNLLVANGTGSGTQFVLPIGGDNIASGYLSVTNILAAGGASGNGFRVYALREREISL